MARHGLRGWLCHRGRSKNHCSVPAGNSRYKCSSHGSTSRLRSRTPDQIASLLAKSISFTVDKNSADEQKFRSENDFKIELPDYDKKQPGKVHFFLQTYHILPDRKLQEAINAFGQNLVPAVAEKTSRFGPGKNSFPLFRSGKIEDSRGNTLQRFGNCARFRLRSFAKLQNEAQLASCSLPTLPDALKTMFIAAVRVSIRRKRLMGGYSYSCYLWPAQANDQRRCIFCRLLDTADRTRISGWPALRGRRWIRSARSTDCPAAYRGKASRCDRRTSSVALLGNYVDAELGFDYMGIDSPLRKGESEYADRF